MKFLESIPIVIIISFLIIGCGGGSENLQDNPKAITLAPTHVQVIAGEGMITLTWEAVPGTTSYNVYWSSTSGSTINGKVMTVSGTAFDHEKLTYGENYYYVVSAVNDDGESVPSYEVTNTPDRMLISSIVFPDAQLSACISSSAFNENNNAVYIDELQVIDCDNYGISDVTGIGWLTSLTEVWLTDNAITDISPLASLTGLTLLSLYINNITDISPLASLTGLTYLALDDNNITDISPLASLTGLTYLALDDNNITDISPISSLTRLTELWLHDNTITDISPLASLIHLTLLWLGNNTITDVSPLASLTSLTYLILGENEITSGTSSLISLTSATYLDLFGNNNIPCADLTILKDALGSAVVQEPSSCL